MLVRLLIKNIALISYLDVEFFSGLNILTGETGAGKSILIDAINLVLGERAEYDLIKHGESKATVEAEFDISQNKSAQAILNDMDIEVEDGMLIVSRDINVSGRSICRMNATLVTRAALKSVMELLVDVHGQHEHQSLLSPKYHLIYLDAYAHDSLFELKRTVACAYDEYRALERKMAQEFMSPTERDLKIDALKYQINEIESINPMPLEDEELSKKREKLVNAERIAIALTTAYETLYGDESNALGMVKSAIAAMDDISHLSEDYAVIRTKAEEAYYALEDVAVSIREQRDESDLDFSSLEYIDDRINSLNTLKRKYGGSIESVLLFAQNAQIELDEIINGASDFEKNTRLLEQYKDEYYHNAAKLTNARKEAAARFVEEVLVHLADLGLKNASLSVRFSENTDVIPSRDGVDKVEFWLSTNAGEPEKPLSKVASGGEVSRIMLALKTVLASVDGVLTMIFDEIDTGISGETATVVGMKMHIIAKNKQLIAITHLPQIAAFADVHYLVEKTEYEGATRSNLRRLSDSEHVEELARILGGAHSQTALKHAAVMIRDAMSKTSI